MEISNKHKGLKLLSVKDVAGITQAGLSTVRGWIREGKLKSVKVGHFRRVRAADLEKFIDGTENDIEYWEKRFPPLKKGDFYFNIIGIGFSGLTDVSENVDEYLYGEINAEKSDYSVINKR